MINKTLKSNNTFSHLFKTKNLHSQLGGVSDKLPTLLTSLQVKFFCVTPGSPTTP